MAYTAKSPYYTTNVVNGEYLDIMNNRPVAKIPTNVYWTITAVYNYRPDLLAYDLYNDSTLWWVFAQRNPNTLVDPLFDFKTGTSIFLPTIDELKQSLGF